MINKMNNKRSILILVAGVALMLSVTAIVSNNDIFAKKYEKSQTISQTSSCGNGEIHVDEHHEGSTNDLGLTDGASDVPDSTGGTFCQNIDSQIQGDENSAALAGVQQ
jgi:hypothetical protein